MNGSATVQAGLWGERAGDWAELLEKPDRPWLGPAYELVLDRLGSVPDTRLLDVGCGSGRFCVLAGERGARVAGIDATPELLAIARERNPEADLRHGDLQFLPWDDGELRRRHRLQRVLLRGGHRRRVPRGRARRAAGRPRGADRVRPARALRVDAGARVPRPITARVRGRGRGAARAAARAARASTTVEAGHLEIAEEYPDLETLLRAWLSIGPVRLAVRNAGEDGRAGRADPRVRAAAHLERRLPHRGRVPLRVR